MVLSVASAASYWPAFVGVPSLSILFLYAYTRATCGRYSPQQWKNLSGKVAVITGSNIGIGYETAKVFARLGATVVLACRSQERGEAARSRLLRELAAELPNSEAASLSNRIEFMRLDLASFASIRFFADSFKKTHNQLDLLVNNAGVMNLPTREVTSDGLEMQIGVNHFGHFLLTCLLLPTIKQSTPARILVVSSRAHKMRGFDLDDWNWERRSYGAHGYSAYAASKTANVLFVRELARRLKAEGAEGVTVNAVHPGVVRTDIPRYMALPVRLVVYLFSYIAGKSAEEGAQTSLYCALSEELDGVSGAYFADCRPAKISRIASDEQLARRLWEISERITAPSK